MGGKKKDAACYSIHFVPQGNTDRPSPYDPKHTIVVPRVLLQLAVILRGAKQTADVSRRRACSSPAEGDCSFSAFFLASPKHLHQTHRAALER